MKSKGDPFNNAHCTDVLESSYIFIYIFFYFFYFLQVMKIQFDPSVLIIVNDWTDLI